MIKVLKFSIVGGLNTLINYIVYCVLCLASVDYIIALAIAYVVAMINSFFLNKKWTFGDKNKANASQISKFIAANVFAYLLNAFLLWAFVEAGANLYLAQILATAILLSLNFAFYKRYIFKGNPKEIISN